MHSTGRCRTSTSRRTAPWAVWWPPIPDADLIVFSLHGMMANVARVDLLDEMLARVLFWRRAGRAAEGLRPPPRRGAAFSLAARHHETHPSSALQNRLMTAWTTGGIDWTRTPAFCCRADLQGYVRLNLKGREAKGSVAPGVEAEALTARIRDGLMTFRDEDSGEALIEAVVAVDEIMPPGPCRDLLPDLLVMWRTTPQTGLRRVVSPQLGRVARAAPGEGRGPNGRSGNHRPEGILFAAGRGIEAGHKSPISAEYSRSRTDRREASRRAMPSSRWPARPIPELTRTA